MTTKQAGRRAGGAFRGGRGPGGGGAHPGRRNVSSERIRDMCRLTLGSARSPSWCLGRGRVGPQIRAHL
eukprot:15429293-Alexandrium_andersonii.AAC.1